MEDEKKEYQPPRAMRLDDKRLGKGLCYGSGSGDNDNCDGDGNSAGYDCRSDGNSATEYCDLIGNSPSY